MGAMRRFRFLLLVFLLSAGLRAMALPGADQAQDERRHVVLISIDGFRPALYLDPEREGVQIPNLLALRDAGSFADGVEVAAPSLTYPSHTTIATGVHPARHGIVSNTRFSPVAGSSAWYFESSALRATPIWELARARGLRTAGVSWPVTVGANMDVLFPESNQAPPDETWLARARRESTPGLIDAVVSDLGGFGENDNRNAVDRDRFAAAAAAHIIRTARPHLLLVHLMETDAAQHADGPGSPSSREAIARIDAHVGAIVRSTEDAGIRARTTFVITGDHGFSRVHALVQPNVILRDGGWLTTDDRGRVDTWQAAAHATAIRLRNPDDHKLASDIEQHFRTLADGRYRGIFRVIGREELDRLGAYPAAAFLVEPAEGYYVSDALTGDAVVVGTTRRGAHGFLPTETRMRTGLIVAGSGVRSGVPLPLVRQIDLAPTVARLLGFDMPDADGLPLVGVLAAEP